MSLFRREDFKCESEAPRKCRRRGALDLDGHLDGAAALEHEVDLRAVLRPIVIRRPPVTGHGDQILDYEPLPARAGYWMTEQVVPVREVEQRVEETAIAYVDLGRPYEAFADVTMPPQFAELIQPGTSLGGARPKDVVEMDEGLWIARYPEKGDRRNNARVEASMLTLARECGLRACDARVVEVADTDVLLVRRFDRVKTPEGYLRHRFVSALTALDAGETIADRARWSYLLLTDEFRRRSHRASADLCELFGRTVFNALISNTDDHPRNHGLIAPGKDFELAPAYDLTPNPLISVERRDLALTVGRFNRCATRENLLSECERFRLDKPRAAALIDRMKQTVENRWHAVLRSHAVTEKDCALLARAFVYPGFELPVASSPP